MSLNFRLTFGSNFQAADMVIYDNSSNNNGSGGVAGFPSSQGRPHKFIQIYHLDGFSTNANEHVITQEIGHAVEFRHPDWFDRLSCGTAQNEGTGLWELFTILGGLQVETTLLSCKPASL